MSRLPLSVRQKALYAFAAFVLAYTRTEIQYGKWTSWASMLSSLLIHALALLLFIAAVGIAISLWRKRFLADEEPELSIDALSVYLSLGVVIACGWILFLREYVPSGMDSN